MNKTQPGFDAEDLNLIQLAQEYSDPDKARIFLESLLWPNGPICPHCKNHKEKPIYPLVPKAGSKSPVRKGLYKCAACRKEFTVTVGTIFEDSKLPISKWLMAFFILCSSKKAVSAHQLHRMLGITYKTAWFMAHRIRHAMSPRMPLGKLLKGTVEVDETFVGGKGNPQTRYVKQTPVVALIERGGDVYTRVVANVTQKNLGQALNECVDKSATVNTDEHGAYRNPLKQWRERILVEASVWRSGARQYVRKFFQPAQAWGVWRMASCEQGTSGEVRERIRIPLEPAQGVGWRANG